MAYNRAAAVSYAHEWAMKRNKRYLDFSGIGGDCTNFVSQCLHAGGCRMNRKPTFGWYYNSANDRAPAWSSVQYLYNFLIKNAGAGPFAHEVLMEDVLPGDVIQLSFLSGVWGHSLLVVEVGSPNPEHILIATHSDDSDFRPLSTYLVLARRFLKIDSR